MKHFYFHIKYFQQEVLIEESGIVFRKKGILLLVSYKKDTN